MQILDMVERINLVDWTVYHWFQAEWTIPDGISDESLPRDWLLFIASSMANMIAISMEWIKKILKIIAGVKGCQKARNSFLTSYIIASILIIHIQ